MMKLLSHLKHPSFFMAIWLHTCTSFVIAQKRGVDFLSIFAAPRRVLVLGAIGWVTGLVMADARCQKKTN